MKTHIRVIKLKHLTLKASVLVAGLKEIREEMASLYQYYEAPKAMYNPAYFNFRYGWAVKDFNALLKKQNTVLRELAKINKKRRALRVPAGKPTQLTVQLCT